jgi:hypothetical protein
VEDSQTDTCNTDHGTFQDHECDLLIGQRAVESAWELGAAENRTDEDCQSGHSERTQEQSERFTFPESTEGWVHLDEGSLSDSEGEVGAQSGEKCKRSDLPVTIMFFPMLSKETVFAVEAMAPPAAWSNKATKSQLIKTHVYVAGLSLDTDSE